MARSGKTAQEFIQKSFSPIIGVLCSQKVDNVVAKNNLSFHELFQPFTALDWEGQFRDSGGNIYTVKNWKLIIREVNWKPLQPTEARRQLNNAALYNFNDKTVQVDIDGRKFDIPQTTNWFDAWRETYLEVQFPSDHEFTKHFISCIIVGTAHEDNIIDTFNALNQQYAQLQNVAPPKLPKWFNNAVLKTYLLLHDVSVLPMDRAEAAFETLKQTFGASNCFMLSINSKNTSDNNISTDLWSQLIKRSSESNSDISSSVANLPGTPSEPQAVFQPPGVNIVGEDGVTLTTSMQEGVHPLTSPENDLYDNANSLQTHSFSGSVESVSVSAKGIDFSNEVHGAALNTNDIDAIKQFLQDYASKALLPYLEKQISQLSEVVANRKGVSRSLLSATKRWFGTGKPGNTTGNSTVVYTSDCPELQLRRLGDLWFLCGQWQRAFDAYHSAKREFYADSAWLCYAGALEMAAISAFMAGEANRKTHAYMEESIVTYLNTCRMVQYAVRATLLSVMCLSASGFYGEAAKQLIRMTSEDSDLRSAMLLEQAALCFLSGPGAKAMCRKYAFHMVLAGHRFSKAGQKKHAYRCYQQAYQVYAESGWRLASDHVQFALGRLAGALRATRAAAAWLAAPLAPASPQPPHQQDAFLREYMLAQQHCAEPAALPPLPLPLVLQRATAVLCCGPAPLAAPGRRAASALSLRDPDRSTLWTGLEEMLLQVARGSVPMIFKPTVDLYTDLTDCHPIVPQGEPVEISITLWNPLKIPLVLKDLDLLWRFTPHVENGEDPEEPISNELSVGSGVAVESKIIVGQTLKSFLLEGDCKKSLTFILTPLRVGQLNIEGLAYKLINPGEGGNENSGNGVAIQGKINLVSGEKSVDKRLQITVIPEAPCLQMTFSETNSDIISGEMRTLDVEFTNVGPVDMKDLYIAVSHPDCISIITPEGETDNFKILYDEKYRDPTTFADERAARAEAWRAAAARHVRGVARALPRAGAVRARLLLRTRAALPDLRLLAYYHTGRPQRPHRLLRHVFRFTVSDVVDVSVAPRRSLAAAGSEMFESAGLAVEVKNVSGEKSKDMCVEVLQAALLSRQWSLTGLFAASQKDDLLMSRERLHLALKARRILNELPQGEIHDSSLNMIDGHPDCAESITTSPYSKFIMESRRSWLDNLDVDFIQDFTQKRTGLIRSMFILRWKVHDKVKGTTAIGQHCLWLECFTKAQLGDNDFLSINSNPSIKLDEYDSKPDLSEDNKKNKKDNMVIFRMDLSKHITHDFNLRKLCIIPVTLNIVNCYGVPVDVFINMSKQINREASSELGWAGALSYNASGDSKELGVSVSLDKFESRRVRLRGVCAAPGTYLVGSAFTVTTAAAATATAATTATTATTAADTHLNITNLSRNASLLVVQQT
ncbi:trafficking protein particle complex subunit 8 isoform X2 [Manduca sexta]|uniref:trafficking protein particle complex subunit 8 isoform X2 n=1 Tax=Manduca sexta TaxID=7130 RepID=UPI0011822B2E|nr:trafficking protein particle complex subunit 8 isoform X2 [Manduca sexta]